MTVLRSRCNLISGKRAMSRSMSLTGTRRRPPVTDLLRRLAIAFNGHNTTAYKYYKLLVVAEYLKTFADQSTAKKTFDDFPYCEYCSRLVPEYIIVPFEEEKICPTCATVLDFTRVQAWAPPPAQPEQRQPYVYDTCMSVFRNSVLAKSASATYETICQVLKQRGKRHSSRSAMAAASYYAYNYS